MKVKTLFSSLLAVLFLFGLAGADVKYSNPVGHVNDFAKLFSADVARKLETEIRTYKEKTSIEIAVVTVNSLEGLSVEDYTIGLARKWGVGAKKKDNGVVLLVAPNERKVRIEVGYGLEPDLTDSQAGRVIRDQIIPLFKEGRMADGVVAGVAGILQQLGDTPYKARAEERAAIAERGRLEAERQKEAFANFLFVAGIVLAIIAVVGFAVFSVKKRLEWKRKLMAWHSQNNQWFAEIINKISEAESEYEPTIALLRLLKRANPKELWQELEEKADKVPEAIKLLKARQEEALRIHERGYKHSEEARGVISKLHSDAIGYSSVYELVQARDLEIQDAKKKSQELLKNLPEAIQKASEETKHPDIRNEARDSLKDAEKKYSAASAMLKVPVAPMINWLSVYAFLSSASSLVSGAVATARQNKAEADRARKEGPKMLESMPASIKKAEGAVSDSDVSSGTKQKVQSAKKKYQEAGVLAEGHTVDWLSVWVLLTAAAALLSEATKGAESDKDDAERSRRRKRDDDSYHRSPSSSWSSSSSGSSGGGFGGFGGGGFGGGGASGSW